MVAQNEKTEKGPEPMADKFARLRNRKHKPKMGRPLSSRNRLVFIEDLIASGYGSRAKIWRQVADGTLPRPFRYGGKSAWREATISKSLDKLQPISGKD